MRRQILPRLLFRSRISRARLETPKPGNYALCRGRALSTLAPGDCPGRTTVPVEGAVSRSPRFRVALVPGWLGPKPWFKKFQVSFLLHSTQSVTHIRVKRYRQSMNQGSRSSGCRFGTCTVQKLAHKIYQFTDKDKDGFAPRNKISPQGYGRRRRRSLSEVLRARTVASPLEQTQAVPVSQAHQVISKIFRI